MEARCQSLNEVRENIDTIDRQIVTLLAARGNFVAQAASFKKTADEVEAPKRVEEVIAKVTALAHEQGANPKVVTSVYLAMISAFIEVELKAHAVLQENGV